MKKIFKFLFFLAGVAAAVAAGLLIYKKFFEIDEDYDEDDFDEFDDYDDEDFEPVKREYVPITLDKEDKKEEAEAAAE